MPVTLLLMLLLIQPDLHVEVKIHIDNAEYGTKDDEPSEDWVMPSGSGNLSCSCGSLPVSPPAAHILMVMWASPGPLLCNSALLLRWDRMDYWLGE